ncbi:folate-binding protein [Neiella marina]|uniref:Folate-binding protein n=1 Tax=Neiella holothuriorum TaxID=2870530 RepID=A0ABS7EB56_9GAMM|nr:folate-binding protein [Neiella holothuriorum]MBW8189568.1 folate-binding protein [Neiella holothuriorum]
MPKPYRLSQLGVIQVTGDDQRSYLQGQLTCDMSQLDQQHWLAGCHCDAKGKMWSNFILLQADEGLFMVMHRAVLPASLAALQKFGVFAKVDITDVSADIAVYGQLTADVQYPALATATLPFGQLWLANNDLDADSDDSPWQIAQIQAGWPLLCDSEHVGELVPQMLNQAAIGAVSFKKGCYIGQETVARMQYLGKQKRATFYLTATAAEEFHISGNNQLEISRNGNWRKAGTLLNSVLDQDGKLHTLAVLASDASNEESYRLVDETEASIALSLQPLPYEPMPSSD